MTIALFVLYIVLIPFFWTRFVQAGDPWWRSCSDPYVLWWSLFFAVLWPSTITLLAILYTGAFLIGHLGRFFRWMPRYVHTHRK